MKRKIGYLPQHLQLPRWVTGKEILNYCASLYQLDNPKSKIADMIDTWDCSSYINRPLSTCSHGMQKRIGLSIATIHSPDLLILDEPFSGLDLYHMKSLENLIISRKEHHKATILSTHINSFVAKLCQHVFVLKNGNVKVLEKWKHNSIADKISMIENEFF
jgi:ABC-type multidrug transport system ATPase subunit